MRIGSLNDNGRECNIYDSIEEVQKVVGYKPPQFCNKDATKLIYYSFFDSLERFTVKACCPLCHDKWAISINQEKYEAKMLQHWTERVKKRDGNKCRMASSECSGPLHAHHMIPKALDPTKIYDVENGITLCEAHHKKIHKFM